MTLSRAAPPRDFKFEVQHFLVSKEAVLRCAVAQSLSRPGVEFLGDLVAVGLGEFGSSELLEHSSLPLVASASTQMDASVAICAHRLQGILRKIFGSGVP